MEQIIGNRFDDGRQYSDHEWQRTDRLREDYSRNRNSHVQSKEEHSESEADNNSGDNEWCKDEQFDGAFSWKGYLGKSVGGGQRQYPRENGNADCDNQRE